MANKTHRGIRLILLGIAALVIIGCTSEDKSVFPKSPELEKILYPGAPIISIHKTSVDWEYEPARYEHHVGGIEILYRLEAKEPLPYDIEVKLKVDGRSETENGWTGIIDRFSIHEIKKGALVSGKPMTFQFYSRVEPDRNGTQGEEPDAWRNNLRMQTVTVSIAPWDAIGDDAYNVGSPSTFTVTR